MQSAVALIMILSSSRLDGHRRNRKKAKSLPSHCHSSTAKASRPDDEESGPEDSDVTSVEGSDDEETEQAEHNANGQVLVVDESVSLKEAGLGDLHDPKTVLKSVRDEVEIVWTAVNESENRISSPSFDM